MENLKQPLPKKARIAIAVLCFLLAAAIVGAVLLFLQNNAAVRERDALSADLSTASEAASQLETQRDDAAAALADANQTIDGLNAQIRQLQAESGPAAPQTEPALADLQAEYGAYKEDSQAKLDAFQKEYDAYKADAEARLAAAGAAGADAQKLADLQATFDTYKVDAQAKLDALQSEYDAYKADAEARLAAAGAAGADGVQPATNEAGAKSADLQAKLDALQSEYDAYKADAEAKLAAAITAGKDDVQTARDAGAKALTALQNEYDAYRKTAEADLAAAAKAPATLQSEYDAYKADSETKLSALQGEYDAYKTDSVAKLTALQGEYDAYKTDSVAKLTALQGDFDAYKADSVAKLAALQGEYDAYKAGSADKLTTLQGEYDAYRQTSEAASATAATALAGLQTALTALQSEYDTYKADAETTLSGTEQALASSEQALALLDVPTDTNGAGNTANGNLAVYSKGTIYYHNNYDKGHIYSENAAGYDDVYLRKTSSADVSPVRNIAAVEDGDLYYLNANRLYRFNLADGEAEFMKNNMDLYSGNGMLVADEKIYFLKSPYDAAGNPVDNLYDIKFSCNNLEAVPGVRADGFAGDAQGLYYTQTGTGKLLYYDFATATSRLLLDTGGASCLNLAGDTLYFSQNGRLMKMKTDGSGLAAIGGATAGSLNVVGDWIYYSNTGDGGKICRIKTDGSYNERVVDVDNACCINIAGDWIYFIQYAGEGDGWTAVDTYKARLDGTDLQLAKPE